MKCPKCKYARAGKENADCPMCGTRLSHSDKMTKKLQRQFADSIYDLVMKSPKSGEPMGIWKAGYGEDGNIEIGIGDQSGTEFWVLKFETREASEIEVKSLSFDSENDQGDQPTV